MINDADDLCDLCMSSGVNVARTTYCGKTIGIECGCDESHPEGTCGDPSCEDCSKHKAGDSGRDWLERAVSRLQDEIQALPEGLQDEDYPALDAAIDTLNSILTGELKPTPEQHKLALITDIIVNQYGEENEPFSKKELKQILDAIVEIMDAK
jgi:hypothetical protein